MIRETLIVAACAMALAGCATRETYESDMNAWVGRKSTDLVASWGAPTSTDRMANGGTVLTYNKQRGNTVQTGQLFTTSSEYIRGPIRNSGPGTSYGQSTGYTVGASPARVVWQCVTKFTTDSAGTIRSWTAEGNDCIA